MASLPVFQTPVRELSMMQTQWKTAIDPVITMPMNQGIQLTNVRLSSGANTINHLLGRKQQGWIITDIDGSATIYRSAALNDKTLTLTSNAACTVALWVY